MIGEIPIKFKKKTKKNKQVQKNNFAKITLYIPRKTVEDNEYLPFLLGLCTVLDQAPITAFEGSMTITFEGYEDDPRELFEIPEVCKFMRNLDNQFPYWSYLADLETDTLETITKLLCNSVTNDEFYKYMTKMGHDLGQWAASYGIPFSKIEKRAKNIVQYYERIGLHKAS